MLINSAASQRTATPPPSAERPIAIYETSTMSPDLLVAMSKDFGRPEVCAARSAFAKAKQVVAVEPKRLVNGADRVVLRFPRYAMRQIAAAMEQQDPAVGAQVRQAVKSPEAYDAPRPTR